MSVGAVARHPTSATTTARASSSRPGNRQQHHPSTRREPHPHPPGPEAGSASRCNYPPLHRTLASFVLHLGNSTSRTDFARGRRKLPQKPADPRKTTDEKPRSRRKSPPTPAQPGSTMTGLSRRRSRVRVPSLPVKNILQIKVFCCPYGRKRPPAFYRSPAIIPHATQQRAGRRKCC